MSDRQKAIDALLGPGDAWDDDQILGACYAVDKAFAALGIRFDADGNIAASTFTPRHGFHDDLAGWPYDLALEGRLWGPVEPEVTYYLIRKAD